MALLIWAPSAGAVSGVVIRPGREITTAGRIEISEVGRCNITLSGSFNSSLVAIGGEGVQLGSVTGLSTSACTGSSVTPLGLPWAMRLATLQGVNPSVAVAGSLRSAVIAVPGFATRVGACLSTSTLSLSASFEALGENEYTMVSLASLGGMCSSLYFIELGAPSPRQVFTFLAGGEVIDGFTPNPVVFGTVRAGEVVQRRVTIGSAGGGRIEEVVVTSQRYFAITDPNECRGRTLAARGTCDINVILSAPREAGRSVSDTLTVRIAERRFEGTLRAST
jgi:hypothetical protein